MALKKPICFISYSWEGKRHQNWVSRLAQALVLNGVRVRVDFWDTHYGMDISKYMETSVRRSSHVLIVCTPKYAGRADARKGGVGAETSLVTGEAFTGTANKKKFVPILRQGVPTKALPTYLKGKLYIDFRRRAFRKPLEDLLRHVFDERESKRPELGKRPNFPAVVLPKSRATAKRAAQPKRRVVRKKQRELHKLMSGSWKGAKELEKRREAVSRAATDLAVVRPPTPEGRSAARVGGRRRG
ncbi:MAG: toll/interleukin-1 receptor domain-containing protein [Acidobacteriota bacterium]